MKTPLTKNFQNERRLRHVASWKPCTLIALLAIACYFLLPDYLPLLSRICTIAILVISLDLVVGYAGLATLGHAAFFGVGAYAAANVALWVTGNAWLGLLTGMAAGAGVAGLSGLIVLRYQGFTFLMLTIAVAQVVHSTASKLTSWTGGDDGLSGFTISPIFGFSFDMRGHVAYVYSVAGLLLCYWVAKRIVDSPFGLSVLGISQCRTRMDALGTAVTPQLWKMYTLAGAMAGFAGALSAQINGIVGLDSLGFELSADVLVMLILGGAGSLYGALIGSAIFITLHHTASSINPYHWLFVIGALLMLVVLLPRKMLSSGLVSRWRSLNLRRAHAVTTD